jgi:hypothetical protein
MKDNKPKDWKRLLAEVMAETDKTRLAEKTYQLEGALFYRCQEAPSDVERQALKGACDTLLHIRVEKLGFPFATALLSGAGSSQIQ